MKKDKAFKNRFLTEIAIFIITLDNILFYSFDKDI